MKRNWKTRLLAGFVAFLMMVSLVPTGVLSDLVPQIVPDTAVEAEAVAGGTTRISGLFYIRINSDKTKYMTNSNWYLTQSTFETKKSGDALLSQMWLIVNDGSYYYLRSLSDVMANKGGTYGNRWLSWDHTWNGATFPTCKNIDTTVSAEPGNPTGQGTYKWELTSRSANSDGSFTCYIKESAAAYYIQNSGGKVQTGRALGNTAGDLMYLEPCYDPMFENDRPLQLINQPLGTTSYKINNSSGTTTNMTTGNTVNNTWAVVKANQGYWYIINRATGYYLAGNQTTVGAVTTTKNVTGNPANDASIQWQIVRQRYTQFTTYIIINKGTQLVLQSNGTTASTSDYNFGSNMYTYWTMGYNADFGDEVPEAPQFYSWTSGTYRYFPATFTSQAGYTALRANQAKSIDGDLTGYLFDTAALSKLGSATQSLTNNSTNHFWYNSAYAGIAKYPTAHSLGTTRIQYSCTQGSGQFLWIIGHGTQVTAKVNGTTYTVTDGIKKITMGTSGTGTVDITASGHFGIFTNTTPASLSGSVSVTMEGTNSQVIHSDTDYTVRVTNNTNYRIDNVCFTVSISGGHSVTITVTNGSGSSGNTAVATVSGGSRSIDPGGSATWTITMKPGGMTAGTNYTITANAGTYVAYNSATSQPNATNTLARGTTYSKSLQECNGGSVTATVTTSPNGGTVNGTVTYTISIKNNCNHAVSDIDFTFGNSSTTILKVVNGKQNTLHSKATAAGIANTISANGTLTITVTVNFSSGFTAGSGYQFAVSSGSAKSGCSSAKPFSSNNSTSVTTAGGGVSVSVTSNVSNNAIVRGNVVYTVKFTNNANHDVNKVDFTLKAGSTALLTITDGSFTKGTGVSTDVSSIGTITKNGGTATVVVTVDTTKLAAKTGYTIASSGGYCEATGLVAGSRGINITGTGTVQTITTASGTGMSIAGGASITSGMTVEGEYYYDITVTNGANHGITGIDYIFYNGSTPIVTVKDGVVTVNDTSYVRTDKTSLGNVAAGGTVTLRIYIDTTKLTDGSSHTFKLGNLSCNATGISGGSSSYELTATASYSHSITVRKGNVTMTWTPSISAGSVVEGTYTYKVTFTNGTNHKITGIDYIIKYGNTTVITVSNGKVTATGCASANKETLGDLEAGASVELLVTIDTTKLTDKGEYTFTLSGGSSNATGLAGSNAGIELKPTTNSYSHNIIVRGGNVVLDWSSIASGKVVEGTYNYTVTFKNEGNHKVVGVDYIIKVGNTNVITVSNGQVTVLVDYLSVDKNTVSDLAAGATDTLVITVDTTKLTDGQSYTFYLVGGTATANGIVGSNSGIELNSNTNKSHVITVREGDISVSVEADSVVDKGVAEGDTSYTITLENNTNHTLKDIAFVLKDNAGNTLLTVASNGTITIVSDLVKNGGTINGSLTNLTSGATVTITGIIIDADADVLDETGRLIVKVSGSAKSSDVLGSAADVPYSNESAEFTVMVRHDVNLMVQTNLNTTINATTIFAAMDKSGAYATEKANGLAANAISKIEVVNGNGQAATVAGVNPSGSSLVFVLGEKHVEYVIKVTYSGGTVLVPIQTSSYNAGALVQQVLDYGLPVTLTGSSLMADVSTSDGGFLTTTGNLSGVATAMGNASAATVNAVSGVAKIEGGNLTYTPNKFMEGIDNLYAVIRVATATATTANVDYVDIYKHVQMIPANVIYYEDTFPAINYLLGNTITEIAGNGGVSTGQSAGDGNYGFDDGAYASSSDVTISGLSMKKIYIKEQGVVATFSFTGTGFELLSRCNAFDSATIIVRLKAQGSDAWKYYPVITTFDHNNDGGEEEVYQVPVFRIQDLAYGNYDIEIVGLPRQDFNENGDVISTEITYLYVDGVRIFNPVAPEDAPDAYGEQAGVTFGNVSTMVKEGKATVATYNNSKVTGFVTGNYFYLENYDGLFETNMGDVNALNAIGANNEIYINGNVGNYALVFKVKPTGNSVLQVGFRDVHDGKFMGTSNTNSTSTVWYGTASNTWVALRTGFTHGTEQYYSIDLSSCPLGDDGYYTVVLKVAGFVSFTSIKSKNLDFMTTASVAAGSLLSYNDDGTITVLDNNGTESTINTNAFFDIKHIEDLTKSPVVTPIGDDQIG